MTTRSTRSSSRSRLGIVGLAFALCCTFGRLVVLIGSLRIMLGLIAERVRGYLAAALDGIPSPETRRQLRSPEVEKQQWHGTQGCSFKRRTFIQFRQKTWKRSPRKGNGFAGLLLYEKDSHWRSLTRTTDGGYACVVKHLQTILVNSGLPGEGKTTAVVNGLVIPNRGKVS